MKCKHVRKNFLLLLDAELSIRKQKKFQHHLEDCSSCRQQLAQAKNLYSVIDKLSEPSPPPFLWTRVSAVIHKFESSRTPLTTLIDRLPKLAASFSMILLFSAGIGAGIFLGSTPGTFPVINTAVESLSSDEYFVQASGLDTFDALAPQSISSVYAVFTFNTKQ